MVRDAEAHADEAHALRELADAREPGRDARYQTEKSARASTASKLDEADASTIEARIDGAEAARSRATDVGRDPREDRGAQEASHKLAEAVYAQAQAEQAAGAAGGNGAPSPTTRSSRRPTTR